jgi:hypothetical protein
MMRSLDHAPLQEQARVVIKAGEAGGVVKRKRHGVHARREVQRSREQPEVAVAHHCLERNLEQRHRASCRRTRDASGRGRRSNARGRSVLSPTYDESSMKR